MFKMKRIQATYIALAIAAAASPAALANFGDVYVASSANPSSVNSDLVWRYNSAGGSLGEIASGYATPRVNLSPVSNIAWVLSQSGGALGRYNSSGGLLSSDTGYTGVDYRSVNPLTGDLWVHKFYSGPNTGGDPFVEGSPLVRAMADGSPRQIVLNQYAFNFFGLNSNAFNGDMIYSDAGGIISRATSSGTVFNSGYGGWVYAKLAADPNDGAVWFANSSTIFKSTFDYSTITAGPFVPPGLDDILVNPTTSELLVAGPTNVNRYNNSGLQGSIFVTPLAGAATSVVVDPATGDIYIANNGDIYRANSAGVLQGVGPLASGYTNFVEMAWNPQSNSLFVAANTGGGILDSISPAGAVTPIASGLGTISDLDIHLAPEPASAALLAVTLVPLALRRRRA